MTDIERGWLLLVFEAILPSGAHERLRLGARDVPLGRFLATFFRTAPWQTRVGLRAALWAVMLGPPLVLGRLRTFAGLSPRDRVRMLDRMGASPIYLVRELPMLLKVVACMGYAAVPRVREQIGASYQGDPGPAWAAEEER